MKRQKGREEEMDDVIGEIIHLLRVKNHKTLREVSDKIGISYQQMQKYEMGKTRVSVSRLFSILDCIDEERSCMVFNTLIKGLKLWRKE